MHHILHRRQFRQSLVILVLILLGMLSAPRSLLAQSIVRGESLDSGEVIDNDVIMFGDDVQLAGTVKGNAFITGSNITIDGDIEGSLFAIGQRITINGSVGGSAYLTALITRLGSTGSIGQNLYFVGVSITTDRGSQIGRDLNGLSLGAVLQGSVGRNTQLIAGLVQFLSLFMDSALGPAPAGLQLAGLTGRAPGLGQFLLPGNIVIDVLGRSSGPRQEAEPAATQGELVAEWFLDRLRDLLPLLTVALIGYWLLRRPLVAAAEVIQARPLPALGIGLLGLTLAGFLIGTFILVFILILMLGIWLGTITLWNMAWLFWSIAFPLTALAFSLFLIFLNYGTKVIFVYAVMTLLMNRLSPRSERFRLAWVILGLIVFVLLSVVPILGWVISIVVTAWGIGAAWLAWRGRRRQAPEAVIASPVEPEVVPDEAPFIEKLDE